MTTTQLWKLNCLFDPEIGYRHKIIDLSLGCLLSLGLYVDSILVREPKHCRAIGWHGGTPFSWKDHKRPKLLPIMWYKGSKCPKLKDVEKIKILTVILVYLHLSYLKDICLDEHVLIVVSPFHTVSFVCFLSGLEWILNLEFCY